MTTAVTPTQDTPRHHLTLSDGSTTVGFILTDSQGNTNELAIKRYPLQRTALQTSQGNTKYSDLQLPYMSIAQDDWSGGRGNEVFEDDVSRYNDSYRVQTDRDGYLILGPQETYGSGNYRTMNQDSPGSLRWAALVGTGRYISAPVVASASFTTAKIELWIARVGTPGTLSVRLYSNSGGSPHTMLAEVTITAASVATGINSLLYQFTLAQALTSGTTYHLVVGNSTEADTTTNCWEIGYNASGTGGKKSEYSDTWASNTFTPYYRILAAEVPMAGKFFEYKRSLYFVSMLDSGGNSTLYRNGDRGAADANTGALTTLVDATKSWTTNEWANCIALIIKGPGSEENQPWRTITSNTSTALTVSSTWNVEHTTSTEYVILKSNKWTNILDISAFCTDLAVADDFVYFARGESVGSNNVLRYQEYNSNGVWTARSAADVERANKLVATYHPDDGFTLWLARQAYTFHGSIVLKGHVPKSWGDLYSDKGTLLTTDVPWDSRVVANVTQTTGGNASQIQIAAGHTTGIAAVKNLATPIDVTRGDKLGVLISSSAAIANIGDLEIVLDDQPDLGKAWTASEVKYYNGSTYADQASAKDGDAATAWSPTIVTTDRVYVMHSEPFGKMTFDIGATFNDVASVMTVQYFNGNAWTSLSITDGTDVSGDTLKQDGSVTWTIPYDWEECTVDSDEGYWVRWYVSVNLTASVNINEITVTRQNNVNLDLPAFVADQRQWATLDISPVKYPGCDYTRIAAVGLNVVTDSGATNVTIYDGIKVLGSMLTYTVFPGEARITKLEAYAGNTTDPVENPWVFTESGVWEIQQQSGDAPVKVPIGEMKELRSETTGQASTVNDVYLYFSLGDEKLQQYYARNLNDIGPDRDTGLPSARRGKPAALLSYPGRVFAVIDGGSSNTSSIMLLRGQSWHEVYRAPRTAARIRAIYNQVIPDGSANRLWFVQGGDLLHVPYSLSPLQETGFNYVREGHLITSWMYAQLRDVRKVFSAFKLFGEALQANAYYVELAYQKDNESTWTAISGAFDSLPVEELSLGNLSGRRIRFRLRLISLNSSTTPVVRATVLEAYAVVPPKFGYSWITKLSEGQLSLDLEGDDQSTIGQYASVEAALTALDAWVSAATPLTQRCTYSAYDNKTVILDPLSLSPLRLLTDAQGTQIEEHLVQVLTNEI